VRTALYLAAMTAAPFNPLLRCDQTSGFVRPASRPSSSLPADLLDTRQIHCPGQRRFAPLLFRRQ
jgi:hypothetical protein